MVAGGFPVTGVRFGNVLVTLQPVRAFGEDAASILHDPDVPVPHHYVAAYQWIRYGFGAHAAIHLGTHGSLEWLPGESIGLSADCDPDVTLGELPNLYPYIVNNPGEGTQAKRRGNAALIGHLPPAATNAGAYEELEALDQAIDDYREAVDLGSARAPAVAQRVWQLVQDAHLDQDLGIEESPVEARAVEDMVGRVDNYLGFLKEAQITTGLHVLGSGPQGDRLAEYLVALTRQPRIDRPSLRALALELAGLDLTSVLKEPGAVHRTADDRTVRGTSVLDCAQAWSLELMGAVAHHATSSVDDLVTAALDSDSSHRLRAARPVQHGVDEGSIRSALDVLVREVRDELLPLLSCDRELTSILDGLDGRRIEPGASGAPTAGEWSMLPAGRNFHSVNPLSLPSREAWAVGQQLAADLLERYRCDHGDYPAEIGFDLRGIPEMRTKGEDVAEVLALLGVRPVHESWSAEVRTVEVIPLADLRRPRIDVTVRMSGLFRDTFPNLIALLDEAVQAVAFLDEPEGMNFVAAHVLADVRELRTLGVPDRAAQRRASYRLFGGKPGAYGAGPERLVEEKAWETRGELGNIYIEYGGYAYTADEFGEPDVDGFVRQLRRVDAAVRNLDTREIDLLSCSCQYGHLGGMVAAVESVRGVQPVAYIGDSSDHARLTTRTLREEMKVQLCSLQSEVDREHAGTRLQGGGRDRREGRSIVRVGCHRGGDGRLDVRRSGRAVRTGRADQGVDGGGQPPRATEHHRAAARGAPARDVECLAGAHRRTAVPLPRIGGRRRGVGGAMTATRKAALRAMTASRPPVFPFSAIVGQEAMKLALILTVIDPGIGGVLVQGTKGTAKSTAVRALAAVLPPLRVVAGSWSNADPDDPHQGCGAQSSAPGRFDEDRASGEIELRPMSVVELPLGVTEDRVVGSLDIHATLQEGRQRFAPGLLAKANRNILYVDEVNLLDDHIVDVLLDAAAMGTNTVERDGISVTHAARFVLVGTMNPEEGDLRPQLIDRFGLSVDVGDICDPQQRLDVLDRRLAFDQDPVAFLADWDAPQRALADRIVRARQELPSVQVPRELKLDIARLSIELAVEGHRADLVLQRAAAASAAYADRQIAARSDARRVAPMVLRHRLRRMPFEDATQHHAKLERAVTTVLGDAG